MQGYGVLMAAWFGAFILLFFHWNRNLSAHHKGIRVLPLLILLIPTFIIIELAVFLLY